MRQIRKRRFAGSASYWQNRYAAGLDSGRGSSGELANFKAEFLNRFVYEHGVNSVIEFGCGDGRQLSLASYPQYLGLDVAPAAIDLCSRRFVGDQSKSFYLYEAKRFIDNARVFSAELALSLDVIYHLVEDDVFSLYMTHLFNAADLYVIIYSTNHGYSKSAPHVRHRNFTTWVEAELTGWQLLDVIKNRYPDDPGGWADFFVYRRTTLA